MDFVFLGKFFGEGEVQLVEVLQSILRYLRAGGAAQEEGCFRVLEGFGSPFVEGSFAACVARFSEIALARYETG
jgi:hypothetical protein